METFSAKNGYTVEDMLHFGYGHVDAARALFEDDPAFLDSAGYLAHLGVEVVLKAWHLLWFGQFVGTHDLIRLYDELKKKDSSLNIGPDNEAFLTEIEKFNLLRYPRQKKRAVEVGSDQLAHFDALLDALWEKSPKDLKDAYEKLDPTRKGGRVLMKRKIVAELNQPHKPVDKNEPQAACGSHDHVGKDDEVRSTDPFRAVTSAGS